MNTVADNNHTMGLVLLGDVRDSRSIADRPRLQAGLRRVAGEINREKSAELQVPFSISGGDEVQGLLADPAAMVEVIDRLAALASGFAFRFGVGWGAVATPLAERTWEMDGACFHHAREAIARAKKEDRWVAVAGFGAAGDRILDAIFRVMQEIREAWTPRQREAVATRRAHATQTAAAAAMGLDDSTLSKMLKAAGYKPLVEMEQALPLLVRRLLEAQR